MIIGFQLNGDALSSEEIDKNTICQCTGMKDKNGRLIWENDIMKYQWDEKIRIDVVKYESPFSNPQGIPLNTTKEELTESTKIAVQALEKQISKKPTYEGDGYADGHLVYDTWICPCCEKRYEVDYDNYDYCPNCGQKLDWEDDDE